MKQTDEWDEIERTCSRLIEERREKKKKKGIGEDFGELPKVNGDICLAWMCEERIDLIN